MAQIMEVRDSTPKKAALVEIWALNNYRDTRQVDNFPSERGIVVQAGTYDGAVEKLLIEAGKYGDVCMITETRKRLSDPVVYTLTGNVHKYLDKK